MAPPVAVWTTRQGRVFSFKVIHQMDYKVRGPSLPRKTEVLVGEKIPVKAKPKVHEMRRGRGRQNRKCWSLFIQSYYDLKVDGLRVDFKANPGKCCIYIEYSLETA